MAVHSADIRGSGGKDIGHKNSKVLYAVLELLLMLWVMEVLEHPY